jgi:hypothetical protein
MAELKRVIKCSNCGTETSIYLSSELALSEVLIHGKCERCGNTLQLNFSIVKEGESVPVQSGSTKSSSGEEAMVNLDETLFEPELPSDTIKDLIEE